ncbi:hypothetical protein FACS1894126_6150 [Alphaproteobacteria bacterium]|nr:hypothetical protein FACS1894126_6150 [Alphaproteobacteria bacterium]
MEVAIVISIIGLISGFFITKAKIANKTMKIRRTKENIEIVKESLAAYLASHNRLPRPTEDSSGLESENFSSCVGNVPFRTLDIPEKHTLNGDAKKLIYIVEPELTKAFQIMYKDNTSLQSLDYFCKDVTSKIKIDVRNPNDKNADVVAFVIDTEENRPSISSDTIYVKVSTNTNWVTRNFFIIRYLKGCPCNHEEPERTSTTPVSPTENQNNFLDAMQEENP